MTILGDNFRNRPGAKCIFGNVTTTLTFIDSKRAVCISPPSLIKQRNMVNLTVMLSFDDIANPDLSSLCPGTTPASNLLSTHCLHYGANRLHTTHRNRSLHTVSKPCGQILLLHKPNCYQSAPAFRSCHWRHKNNNRRFRFLSRAHVHFIVLPWHHHVPNRSKNRICAS